MQFGRTYEEFEVGAVYKHWPGKTVTEYDDHLFCLLTMNHHPLHLDAHYAAETTDFGQNVVVGNYIYSLLLGMSVPDVSGQAIANLEVESLKHVAPTFHGDTIYGETTVLGKRLTSRGDRGVVEVETRGYKQDGTLVCVFRRKVMVPTETYVKERGGAQPGRPEPDPGSSLRSAQHGTPRADRRPDRVRAGHPGHRPGLHQPGDHPGGDRTRAPGRVPGPDRRGDEETRPVRADHRRGVRRPGRVPAHLRPGRGGDRPRLDVGVGHHQHPLHRRPHDRQARHRRAEGLLPAPDGGGRRARRLLHVRARPGLGRRGHPHPGGARRRRLRAQRAEDVADQRRHLQPGGGAVQDRRRPRRPAPEHEHVPDREGAGLRREPGGPRPDRAGEDREDGVQGRRHHRVAAGRRPRPGQPAARRPVPARASTR